MKEYIKNHVKKALEEMTIEKITEEYLGIINEIFLHMNRLGDNLDKERVIEELEIASLYYDKIKSGV